MTAKNNPDAPSSPHEDGATFGELMARFEAAAQPMRVMLAPELAEWLDRWQVTYDGQPPQPEALDEYRDCTITEKLHYLILMEKRACERARRDSDAWRDHDPFAPEEP